MAKKNKKVTEQVDAVESESTQSTQESGALADANTARSEILAFVETTITHVETRLAGLNDGEKVAMQTLCAEISKMTGIQSERIYPVVSMYVNRRSGVTVARGRDGGIYKGARPTKPVDPEQAVKLQKRAAAAEAKAAQLADEAKKLRERAGHVAPQAQA